MNKTVKLLTILIAMKLFCGMVLAYEEPILTNPAQDKRPTLNAKGDHLPNLGPTQEEFYKYCIDLDLNTDIQYPVVAIFGGAYGKRAAAVLQQTSRVTVVLNDLDERHFTEIQQWSKKNNFNKRLILAPGSFLNMHECQSVKDYFKHYRISFNAVLMANVFHYLHPIEGMKGLRYIADHLVENGQAFLMTAQIKNNYGNAEEEEAAKYLLNLDKSIPKLEHGLEDLKKCSEYCGISFEDSYTIYMQDRQQRLLYEFNKTHSIPFPGYSSDDVDTLNPFFLKLNKLLLGTPERKSFFVSTPEEMKEWCSIVGLEVLDIQYMNVGKDQVLISNPDMATFYFIRIKHTSTPHEAKYSALLEQAGCVTQMLQKLHRGKHFDVKNKSPYFEITDIQPMKEEIPPLEEEKDSMKGIAQTIEREITRMYTKGDFSPLVIFGRMCFEYKEYDYAKDLFRFASDMGVIGAQEELDKIRKIGA